MFLRCSIWAIEFLTMNDQAPKSGTALEKYRGYLAFLARIHVSPRLNAKADLSGIVQQTMLEAYQDRNQRKSLPTQEQMAYLRRILANNARDEVRKYSSNKRDVLRERSLDQEFENSSMCLMNCMVADVSSPSMQLNKEERAMQLATALSRLPDAQREALVLQHWEGKSGGRDRGTHATHAISGRGVVKTGATSIAGRNGCRRWYFNRRSELTSRLRLYLKYRWHGTFGSEGAETTSGPAKRR